MRSILIDIQRVRIEPAFRLRNSLDNLHRDAIAFARGIPASGSRNSRRHQRGRRERDQEKGFCCVVHEMNLAGWQASLQRRNTAEKRGVDV